MVPQSGLSAARAPTTDLGMHLNDLRQRLRRQAGWAK